MKGQWSLPGGAVETGEPLEDALRREVREETGLDVTPSRIALIFERVLRDKTGAVEYHYVLVDYFCTVNGGTLCAGDDSDGAEWVRCDDLDRLPVTSGTTEVIRAALERKDSSLVVVRP